MDLLRACYTQQVRFYRDSDQLTTIRWYFTDLEPLDVPTIFGSYVWEQDNDMRKGMSRGTIFQGEQLDSDPIFSSGEAPFAPGFPPGHYCGTPAQWLGDLELARDGEATQEAGSYRPTCCGAVPQARDACHSLTGPLPDRLLLSCSVPFPLAFQVQALGGFWELFRLEDNPCQWRSVNIAGADGTYQWIITFGEGPVLRIGFRRTTAQVRIIGTVNPWDEVLPTDPPVDGGAFGIFPPTVRIEQIP